MNMNQRLKLMPTVINVRTLNYYIYSHVAKAVFYINLYRQMSNNNS